MTCREAEQYLDLLAAGACDEPERQAVERHLKSCPACAAGYAEGRRLLGLLDLHWNEAGLDRLRQRIEAEARRRPRAVVLPFVRRVQALAAMILVLLGLGAVLSQVRVPAMSGKLELVAQAAAPQPEAMAIVRGAKSATAPLQDRLLQARHDGKLPPPAAVALALTIRNSGSRTVEVRLGETEPVLELDVQGKGVVRVAAPAAEVPAFLRPRALLLAPGQEYIFRMDRLIAGSPGRLEYLYLTQPGAYTVTPTLRALVNGAAVSVSSEPVSVQHSQQEE